MLKGFIVGLALTIIVGQLPKLFGISKGEGNFFEQLWHVVTHLGGTSGLTLLVGLVSLALVLVLRRVAPMVPGSLVAVLFGILVVWAFSLDQHGVKIVGTISSGLPSLGLPDVQAVDHLRVAPAAVGVGDSPPIGVYSTVQAAVDAPQGRHVEEADDGVDDDGAQHRQRQVAEQRQQRDDRQRGQAGYDQRRQLCLGAGPVIGGRLAGATTGDQALEQSGQDVGAAEMKRETKPMRSRPSTSRTRPHMIASAAESAPRRAVSPAAMAVTTAAERAAVDEVGLTMSCREVPSSA